MMLCTLGLLCCSAMHLWDPAAHGSLTMRVVSEYSPCGLDAILYLPPPTTFFVRIFAGR